MMDANMSATQLVDILRARGQKITSAKLSAMLSGTAGTRSHETVVAIDALLSIPADVAGRPA